MCNFLQEQTLRIDDTADGETSITINFVCFENQAKTNLIVLLLIGFRFHKLELTDDKLSLGWHRHFSGEINCHSKSNTSQTLPRNGRARSDYIQNTTP